jgi:XTP/dITP diphosphohydrolase
MSSPARVRLVVGTNNQKKLLELRGILGGLGADVTWVGEVAPGLLPPAETGSTFEENAVLKARYFAERTGFLCLADDSGLEVDALQGAPGVYSARFAGEPSDDARNNAKLVAALAGLPEAQRGAQFRCAIAVAGRDGPAIVTQGACRGRILEVPRGSGGFGYDPYFYYPPRERSFAELSHAEKEQVSHRGQALRELARRWPEVLDRLKHTWESR